MLILIENKQISPCILSKVKFALGIKSDMPLNKKRCSEEYWDKVVDYIGKINGKSDDQIRKAKKRTDLFIV